MPEWINVAVVAVSAGILVILAVVFIWRWCCAKQPKGLVDHEVRRNRSGSLQDGIAKLQKGSSLHHQQIDLESKRRGNYYMFRKGVAIGVSEKPLFNWADHPSLITDAVENGWSRFAFTGYMSSSSSSTTKSTLLRLCSTGSSDNGRETDVETSWEVCQGSADFMQRIRLNSGLKKINLTSPSMTAASIIRTDLPLPGPPLGTLSFPQEAYFEITILSSPKGTNDSIGKIKEGEKSKLIQENPSTKADSDSLLHVGSCNGIKKLGELKICGKDDGKGELVLLSLGLTAGGSVPLKLPGSYPGSIGFNSTGSVYLDGIKLVFESDEAEWAKPDKVIGCGFDPREKKVFFTVDSELVHVINCKSEQFGTPLYPTLAANGDITVLVNFGQSVFEYSPANSRRTPNPCFIGPIVNSPVLGYEDSKELFSMGRIDAQWLNRCATKASSCNTAAGNNKAAADFDEESEADLFEIVIDSVGRSPNTVL